MAAFHPGGSQGRRSGPRSHSKERADLGLSLRPCGFLFCGAQNFGAEPGVSGCWPQLTPRWPFAKALSYLLSFLAGAAVGFKVSLTLWTLSRAVGPLPSDGLPVHHRAGRACCAESPDLELCRCCSDLCQDHPFSSGLDCDLAAMRSGRAGSCSTAPLPGSP